MRAQEAARLRRAEIHTAIPEIAEIDKQLASTGFKIFDATLRGEAVEAVTTMLTEPYLETYQSIAARLKSKEHSDTFKFLRLGNHR